MPSPFRRRKTDFAAQDYPTIGYGRLLSRIPWEPLDKYLPITPERAREMAMEDLGRTLAAVRRLCPLRLTEHDQQAGGIAALVGRSFQPGAAQVGQDHGGAEILVHGAGTQHFTSSADNAEKLGDVVRRHWSVESMHWLMDCLFRDDECRVRTEHAPANFATIRHIAHNLLRRHPARHSMTTKRLKAAWNEDFLVSLIS